MGPEAEACVTSFLPSAGLKHCSSATPLQSVPSTDARQAQSQSQPRAQSQAQSHSQVYSIPQGVPTRRQSGSRPSRQSSSTPPVDPRRSSGDVSSHSREHGPRCQSPLAAGVPCEVALRSLFAGRLSVSSDSEKYAGAPGTPVGRDATGQAPAAGACGMPGLMECRGPAFHPAIPGVGCMRAPGGYTRQGEAPEKGGKDSLLGRSDCGYYSSCARQGLAQEGGTSGVPGTCKQSHMGLPSVGSLQSAMLPPVVALDGMSTPPLPMERPPQDGDLRTQSARLGGLRVHDIVDPKAYRGASPLERYHSLQDEGVEVHGRQRFHSGRPHLSPPPPSASATPQQGSVFHWAARARIHAKTDLSRRSSV